MNHGYIFILCGFLLPVRYRKQNNHEQVPNISPWLATLSKDICTAAKLGERRLFKVALPETASNHYFSFWSSGRPLDSGQARRQFNFPTLSLLYDYSFFFSANPKFVSLNTPVPLFQLRSFPLYCGTAVVVLLYTQVAFVGCCEWMSCLLYTSPSPRDKRQSRMPSSA